MPRFALSILIAGLFLTVTGCADLHDARVGLSTFPPGDVVLLDGPFRSATQLNEAALLNYDPDRFLAKFHIEAGLDPKALHYNGWEAETLSGFSLGHYLSGLSLLYSASGDRRYLSRIDYIVDELAAVQAAHGDGYLGAIPNGKRVFEQEVATGNINALPFSLNGLWAPFYTHHKVLAGLRDAYRLAGVSRALELERHFADWIGRLVADLDESQVQAMLDCEHGGINEVLVDLYADTGDKEYLDLSRVFHHSAVLDSLANGFDILPNKHGNTQIPKVIGLARRYEVDRNPADRKAAEFFWNRVVGHHTYATGGHGNHEYFGQPGQLRNRLSDETTETCNVYNMLKLSRHLFEWTADARIADYYERALFNHILSSQHPSTGRVIYNLSLEMGGYKVYEDPEGFTCCVGTGMETHAKYDRNIFFKNGEDLYVSQFIAATVDWRDKGLRIIQTTRFPEEHGTTLEIDSKEPVHFTLHMRVPFWVGDGFAVRVNGQNVALDAQPGSFVAISRTWVPQDRVEIHLPFSLRLESMPDDSNRVAVMYGPLVLAGDLGPVDDPRAADADYVPALFSQERDPSHWLEPIPDVVNSFRIAEGVGRPRGVRLIPFYTMHDRRYTVYWDMFDERRWALHVQDLSERLKHRRQLESATVDFFQPGDALSESDHVFEGERVRVVDFRHRRARVADRNGWLAFELAIDPAIEIALSIDYWGGYTGSKTFDILVDGARIATENIAGKQDGEFIDVTYTIPRALTQSKEDVTIRFEPHPGNRAGPFFGARTISKK